MSEYPEKPFSTAGAIRPPAQRTSQPPLVPGERRFHLPALTVHPTMARPLRLLPEPLHHLAAILGLGPFPPLTATVEGNHGRADAQAFPSIAVVVFGIQGGIGEHPIPGHRENRLGQDGTELGGIVGWPRGDGGSGEEVTAGVAGDGQLGPQPRGVLTAGSLEEVAGGVPALQTRAIHGDGRLLADQTAVGCGRRDAQKEARNLPRFSSRPAA